MANKVFNRSFKHKHTVQVREAIGSKSRTAAAQIVNAVREGISLNEAIARYCAELDARDTGFVKEIVYGTLRHRRLLMTTLMPMFNQKLTERNLIIQALLLTAMYQLVFMRTPVHAVVSATVSACGDCGHKSFTPVVNAILRRFLREGAKLNNASVIDEKNAAVEYSFPDWLCERILKAYGTDEGIKILQQSNAKAPMFIRVENTQVDCAEYLRQMDVKQIAAHQVDNSLACSAIMLDNAVNVDELPGFFDGLCSVQDLSAQMAAPLLELCGDEQGQNLRILDCCCAPGGKTAHIHDLAPRAQIVALDVDEERIKQTKNTLRRLKLQESIDLRVLDAQDLSSLEGEFDRILVDAPCSGTGVIRRHPDIKWLRREKDIASLVATQSTILDAAFAKLKVGGILLYTTCSILPEENIQQVQSFLERHHNVKLHPFTFNGQEHTTLQRLPGDDNGDGFFYARFIKVA